MRSEFFNQIKQNRQKFYSQLNQKRQVVETLQNELIEPQLTIKRMPSFSLPEIRLKLPEIPVKEIYTSIRQYTAEAYAFIRPYGKAVVHKLRTWSSWVGKELYKVYHKVSTKVNTVSERVQMFIYNNFVGLFEEDEDNYLQELIDNSDKYESAVLMPLSEQKAEDKEEMKDMSGSSGWFKRFFGNMLISLELDDTQFRPVKPGYSPEEAESQPKSKKPTALKRIIIFQFLSKQFGTLVHFLKQLKLIRKEFSGMNAT